MRFTDLEPGMLVAARDYDGSYERAEVISVSTVTYTTGEKLLHVVEFQTGASKGKQRNVWSREIKCPWNEYEETWWAGRQELLQEEIHVAQAEATKALQTVQLEQLQAALSTLGIESGLGQVVQRTPKGKMESSMALFLPVDEALKLHPVVAEHGIKELTT